MVEVTCAFGINSFRSCLRKAYKSILRKWFRRKKPLPSREGNRTEHRNKTKQQEPNDDDKDNDTMRGIPRSNDDAFWDNGTTSSKRNSNRNKTRSLDSSCFFSIVSSLSRNDSVKSRSTRRKTSGSYESVPTTPLSNRSRSFKMPPSHMPSREGSSRRNSNPIMFSSSSGMLKPLPIQKILECTLEELCYGCTKKAKIKRDVITDNGEIVEEEEVLTINIEPGWKTGTKITFEGKGNDRPGKFREDIIFLISQKKHILFTREGDDLELGIEIPLLKALTGSIITVPLLGGGEMNLTMDDIIYPGYEKVIAGQGMPISKEPGKRGNLRITFLVDFPENLTDSQRSEVVSILQDSC